MSLLINREGGGELAVVKRRSPMRNIPPLNDGFYSDLRDGNVVLLADRLLTSPTLAHLRPNHILAVGVVPQSYVSGYIPGEWYTISNQFSLTKAIGEQIVQGTRRIGFSGGRVKLEELQTPGPSLLKIIDAAGQAQQIRRAHETVIIDLAALKKQQKQKERQRLARTSYQHFPRSRRQYI